MEDIAPPFYQNSIPFLGTEYDYWVTPGGTIDVMLPFTEPPGLSFRACFDDEAQKRLAILKSEHTIRFDLPQDVLELARRCADIPRDPDEVDLSSEAEQKLHQELSRLLQIEVEPYLGSPTSHEG